MRPAAALSVGDAVVGTGSCARGGGGVVVVRIDRGGVVMSFKRVRTVCVVVLCYR